LKYTPENVAQITEYLSGGNNREDTCVLVGIHRDTFYTWLNEHPDFSDAVKRAEAECKGRNIALIQKAATKSWQAAAWWLERKHNREFALRQFNENVDATPEMTEERLRDILVSGLKNLKPEQLNSVLAEIRPQEPPTAPQAAVA
jgi:hypothetical protein